MENNNKITKKKTNDIKKIKDINNKQKDKKTNISKSTNNKQKINNKEKTNITNNTNSKKNTKSLNNTNIKTEKKVNNKVTSKKHTKTSNNISIQEKKKVDNSNNNTTITKDINKNTKRKTNPKMEDNLNTNLEQSKKSKVVIVKKKRTIKLWVWVVLAIICLSTLFISLINIFLWKTDSTSSNKVIEEITEITEVKLVIDNDNTETINEPEEVTSDYWYYVSFPLINVDFTDLKEKNSDTLGWINVNNTNINYPFVHTDNNDYYLNHSFDKTYNDAGWVFLDYRNNGDFSDKNNIIYAHSRLDKTMFGSLSKTLHESWYKNKDNHIIRLSTDSENTMWQIFSVYVIETESYYITTKFYTDESYQTFLDTIKGRSRYDFNTELNTNDNILTLSTCYSETEKTVVHAKLIKREKK